MFFSEHLVDLRLKNTAKAYSWFRMQRQTRFHNDDQHLVDDLVGFFHKRCYTLVAKNDVGLVRNPRTYRRI